MQPPSSARESASGTLLANHASDEHALELTLLMPCLDEARTVGGCVAEARAFLERHAIAGEVLVADNGSADGSREIAARHGARVIEVRESGYGAALAGGIAAAEGRYVIMGDSDGSYDWADVRPILAELRAGHELVMGNRFRGGIQRGAMSFLHRHLGNPVLSALGRRLFGSACGDFYCGQRGFTRVAALRMDLRSRGMEFALEMPVKAALLGLRMAEVPVTLRPDGRGRRSHLRTWRDGWRSLRLFLLYSPGWLFLRPGLLLVLLGGGLGGWLLGGPRALGSPQLMVPALLGCAGTIGVGFQLLVMGFLARMLALAAGLHPPGGGLERVVRALRLEHGLVAGTCLALAGIAGALRSALGRAGDGPAEIDATLALQGVIPWVLLFTLGCQVLGASFFLGLLELAGRTRPRPAHGAQQWTRREAA